MAVNKNFVVKNGLEVGTDLILANTTNSRVGIGTSLPTDTLHVNGGIAGTDFVISGIATIPTLNSTTGTITNLSATTISMGSTTIVTSARQLQNIASLDATTTATIESAIEAGPNNFSNLNIAGVSTFVGLATFGGGLAVEAGVSTFAGAVYTNDGLTGNTIYASNLTQNNLVYSGANGQLLSDNDLTWDKETLTAANLNVVGVTTSGGLIDANGGVSISGGSGLQVTGAATVSTTLGVTGDTTLGAALGVTGNTTIGGSAVIAGINTLNSTGANILGIVTATAFHGDISNATGVSTNIVASVGIQSGGNVVGAGITTLNFIGAGNSILVNGSNPAIVDIQISGGGGAGAATSVGGAAPVDPALGQLWFNNSVARTFIWYDEAKLSIGSSAYWVDASPFDMQGQFIEKTGDNMSGALGFAAGTTGNPGLFVNGSTNTGIYSPAANEFGFVTSGVERIRINATGTSIVGTTTVTGNINAIDGVFTGNVTVGGTLTKQDVTNVDSVGLITARNGINITGGALDLGDGNITNVGEITLDKVKPDNGASWVANMGTDKNISFQGNIGEIGSVTGFQAINDAGNANTDFGIRATSIRLATDNAERLRIHTDGEVECKGGAAGQNALLVSANYAGGANVDIQTWQRIGGAVKAKMIYKDASTDMRLGTDTAHSFSLMTGGTDRLTINSSGTATFTGAVLDYKGNVRSVPLNTQASTYTLIATDAGKAILASNTISISDGVFGAGDVVTIINNTNGDIAINKGSVLYNTADGTNGNRTLATRGIATIYFTHNTTGYISGTGLS